MINSRAIRQYFQYIVYTIDKIEMSKPSENVNTIVVLNEYPLIVYRKVENIFRKSIAKLSKLYRTTDYFKYVKN